ncbi:ABC transporter permease [Archaeoglobus veneficus]|uniref:ABC-type transporter, integral membrane subunit n=1 Tax=Archaeoglobus veneficus (strain DSM 11195 / SNP6) TaxID=693661 RepID=F2KQP8_ARCVS|nr:ABC transporter permease [Archaeoglobus veneficus]AEA46610.1 ABC-type transporter, integral membrane subunit [Archaeoglobus veneficus SNP6]
MPGSEEKRWGYVVAGAVLFIIWHVLAYFVKSPALPYPSTVFAAFIAQLGEGLAIHMAISACRAIYSILLALSLAIPIGLLCHERKIDRFIAPFLYLLYPIPHIVLLPLIILLFGIGDVSKVILIGMIVFFQILVTTRDAARNIDEYYVYSLLSLGADKKDIYRHVVFPACLPKILTALRISVGTAIAVLFFAESFATTTGLGYLIMTAWSRADYVSLYAGIVAMALLGFSLYMALEVIERRLCRWV